jgi:transposase-like protein
MTIFELLKKYGTQAQCIELLEQARWGKTPKCPYCNSEKVSRKTEKNRQSRWQCSKCKKSYSVTVGTIFHHTHLELPYWFAILNSMLNAKKSLSSYQISRDIGIRQPTVLSVQNRIRQAMSTDQGKLLKGIVEMDETYVGGKPRKSNFRDDDDTDNKRGRGTDKLPIVGAVERGGNVVAKVMNGVKLGAETLTNFVKSAVDTTKAHLITDQYAGYNTMALILPHSIINHSIAYFFNGVHTNTIECFWSLLKRAWFGSHHHYSDEKAHLYVAESAYKFNNRKNDNTFMEMIKSS